MKRKGFTLIELLAVIVILAVIALITTPIILNMINNAKKGAAKDSAYGYIEAIEYSNSMSGIDSTKYPTIATGEVSTINSLVKVKGIKPTSGSVTIEKGRVTEATLCINNYSVYYNGKEATIKGNACGENGKEESNTPEKEPITYQTYSNGDIIYLDPITGKKCDNYVASNSYTGVKTGCMKWYAFLDEGENSSKINLLLDHNIKEGVAWNSGTGSIDYKYMSEVKDELEKETVNWIGDKRLISADEIATITGNTTFDSTVNLKDEGFSFKKFGWIFDRTSTVCENSGCPNNSDGSHFGYWTSSRALGYSATDYYAWGVFDEGRIVAYTINTTSPEIRPVITVDKVNLK